MAAAEETLRKSIAGATDARARARLRVELAAVVRARDPAAAREELANAAREGGPTQALTLAAITMARTLPPPERVVWLSGLATTGEGGAAVPGIVVALAGAQLDADQPRDAARTLLALVRDERLPMHHRRAAANRLVRICDRLDPILGRTSLYATAMLAAGKARRALLRRALALPATIERDAARVAADDETLARILLEWTKCEGDPQLAADPLGRLRVHKHTSPAMTAVMAALAPPPERPRPPPAPPRTPTPRRSPVKPKAAFDAALAEVGAGHAHRARRLAEEAVRLSPPGPDVVARVNALDKALREGGFVKEALRLRRTALESVDDDAKRIAALRVLAAEAKDAGLPGLAASWRFDAGEVPLPPVAGEPVPESPAEHYLAAQRMLARGEDDPARVLALLEKALARHPGADAALALAEKLVARLATGEESSRRRLALLRAAHADEYEPARRARLGWRLAAQLEAVGDVIGAVAVLERALEESAPGEGVRVRGERARLLRSLGRPRELAAALEKDAGALLGDARLPVLAEQADLLEAAGEAERALDVRMMALAEFPGAPAVLDDARARLEATGRPIESLALAIAALDHTTDRTRRLALLRDVAVLSEQPDVNANPGDAANAWLAVLGLAATDREAAAAAERLLRAVGDWERCADLLAWQVARAAARRPDAADEGTDQVGLLWRLAELRRERLGEADEALRLYGQSPRWAPPWARWPIRPSWRRWCGAILRWPSRPRAPAWRPARPTARARWSTGRRCCWRANGAETPSATRWRRWISIRATPTRSPRWKRCTRASAAPACWPTSWAGAPRGCRRARRRRCSSEGAAPRSAPGIGRARASLTAARCRWTRPSPSPSPRWARWRRARATGRRSRSCSRARWAWRPARPARGRC